MSQSPTAPASLSRAPSSSPAPTLPLAEPSSSPTPSSPLVSSSPAPSSPLEEPSSSPSALSLGGATAHSPTPLTPSPSSAGLPSIKPAADVIDLTLDDSDDSDSSSLELPSSLSAITPHKGKRKEFSSTSASTSTPSKRKRIEICPNTLDMTNPIKIYILNKEYYSKHIVFASIAGAFSWDAFKDTGLALPNPVDIYLTVTRQWQPCEFDQLFYPATHGALVFKDREVRDPPMLVKVVNEIANPRVNDYTDHMPDIFDGSVPSSPF